MTKIRRQYDFFYIQRGKPSHPAAKLGQDFVHGPPGVFLVLLAIPVDFAEGDQDEVRFDDALPEFFGRLHQLVELYHQRLFFQPGLGIFHSRRPVLEQDSVDNDTDFAGTGLDRFHAFLGAGHRRCHPDFRHRGGTGCGDRQFRFEPFSETVQQLATHFVPKGVHQKISGFILREAAADILGKDLVLAGEKFQIESRVLEGLCKPFGAKRHRFRISVANPPDGSFQLRVIAVDLKIEHAIAVFHVPAVPVQKKPDRAFVAVVRSSDVCLDHGVGVFDARFCFLDLWIYDKTELSKMDIKGKAFFHDFKHFFSCPRSNFLDSIRFDI